MPSYSAHRSASERDGHLPQVFGEAAGLYLLAVGTKCAQSAQQAATAQGSAGSLVRHAGLPDSSYTGAAKALRIAAKSLGAKPVGSLWIGLAAQEPHPRLSARVLNRARRMGMKLA